jgi:hypothetical protein
MRMIDQQAVYATNLGHFDLISRYAYYEKDIYHAFRASG